MPINRNALIRYKTIDRMLRGGRKATLQQLIDECSDALFDYCGKREVSRRTIQNDLQAMRYSEALGYYAPIEVVGKSYYTYTRSSYSITDVPLSEDDMMQMCEAVDVLKQMSAFHCFDGVADVVNRLEDHVASMRFRSEPVILIESNEQLRGLKYITPLHDAITSCTPVDITYKSFRSAGPSAFTFSPYILKEYNNRWFVFGKRHNDQPQYADTVTNLALDRIERIGAAPKGEKFQITRSFRPKEYFRDMIGVSRYMDSPIEHVVFRVEADNVPYTVTKPFHHSQKEVERNEDGSAVFSMDVILNRELENRLLSYCDKITVVSPQPLVERLKKRLSDACQNYG